MKRSRQGATVLIGFAESLAAIEAAWDLLDHGFVVHAFSRSAHGTALAKDRRLHLHQVRPPEVNALDTLADVVDLARQLGWPVLFPLDDASLWLLSMLAESHPEAHVAGPTGSLAKAALNKKVQLDLARQAGLKVPATVFRDDDQNPAASTADHKDFEPPWIIRPILAIELVDGALAKGSTEYAVSPVELREVLARRTDGLMVQQYVQGAGEGLFGQARRGAVDHWSAHRRIRMMNPSGSGSSACRSCDPSPALVENAERLMGMLRWNGLFMLEFLKDAQGDSWFIELNGRAWGSLVLATRRGLSYPSWTVADILDPTLGLPQVTASQHIVARHIGREIIHLALVARGRSRLKRSVLRRQIPDPSYVAYPTLERAAKDVLRWGRSDVAYNSKRGLRNVLVRDTWNTLTNSRRSKA